MKLAPACRRHLTKTSISISEANAVIIINYIAAMKTEINLSDNYRKDLIQLLSKFSRYCDNRPFKESTRADVVNYLETYRKTETQDPLHKWIGTYNIFRIHLLRFFKWLYNPDTEPNKRSKPAVIENIPQLKRKEKSIYKPSDLWTQQDDLLFLKYCPTKREKCYHAISRDTSCRPHEIVKLKNRDVVFKTTGNSQYAEVLVNGKTGTRPIPTNRFDSILKGLFGPRTSATWEPKFPINMWYWQGTWKTYQSYQNQYDLSRI